MTVAGGHHHQALLPPSNLLIQYPEGDRRLEEAANAETPVVSKPGVGTEVDKSYRGGGGVLTGRFWLENFPQRPLFPLRGTWEGWG